MRVPGMLTAGMYGMDVLFNFLLIFPTRRLELLGLSLTVPGAGLGVEGAALGTALSEILTGLLMLYMLLIRESGMKLRQGEPFFAPGVPEVLGRALRLGSPIALEQVVMRMLTPDPELILLGTKILRIKAFAELMYVTQLVCAGILQGRGDTFVSSTLMLGSLWLVRVPLSMLLIRPLGLVGAWLAMSIELNVRGILFLLRFQFFKR